MSFRNGQVRRARGNRRAAKRTPVPRWKLYEQLAAKIMRDFASPATASMIGYVPQGATVKWNDSIYGHDSETERQIDVSIRWKTLGHEYLTVIQAKDYKTAADVNTVGEFSSVVRDVRATDAIIVCNTGFTRSARVYARNLGIRLLGLHDAQSVDWRYKVSVPFLWIDRSPEATVRGNVFLDAGESIEHGWLYYLRTSVNGETHVVDLHKAFRRRWNTGQIPRDAGVVHELQLSPADYQVQVEELTGTRVWRDFDDPKVTYTVRQQAWLGYLSPVAARGVIDFLADRAFIVSDIGADLPLARDDSWEPVTDPEQIAATTQGTLITSENLTIVDDVTYGGFSVTHIGHQRR